MASLENLRKIPMAGPNSESEEDGEIGKEEVKEKNQSDDNDSDSFKEDTEDDVSLNIKPPQAAAAVPNDSSSYHSSRKRSRHSKKHESRRKDRHHSRDRNSHRENRNQWSDSGNRKKHRETDGRMSRHKDDVSQDKQRDMRKAPDPVRDTSHDVSENESRRSGNDVRNVRVKPDPKDGKDAYDRSERNRDNTDKNKDEPAMRDKLEEKKMEWRKKRLLYLEKKEQDKARSDKPWPQRDSEKPWRQREAEKSWAQREGYVPQARDLREKLREKERNEHREKQLDQYRSPPKDRAEKVSSNISSRKDYREREQPIHQEPDRAAPMEIDEKADENSDSEEVSAEDEEEEEVEH